MKFRSDRLPSEAQIVDTFHARAARTGRYDADDCVSHAIEQLTPMNANDDLREAISAIVRRVWAVRLDIPGVC